MQLKPFFDVDVLLENGHCTLKPSLEDIQSAINRAASHVLKSTKNVQNWNQKDIPEDKREPFYDWIAKDKEIVKVILLLTGSIQGTKNAVHTFVESFEEYQVGYYQFLTFLVAMDQEHHRKFEGIHCQATTARGL